MNTHSRQLGHQCIEQARKQWGLPAWRMLSDAMREQAIASQVMTVLLAQPGSSPEINAAALVHVQDVARAALWPDEKHEWRSTPIEK